MTPVEPTPQLRSVPGNGDIRTVQRAADLGFATINDLVAELVAATDIVAPDRLAAARGRAGIGSLAQALAVEGVATPTGVARALARKFELPYIDLAEDRVSPDAAEQIPLRTLKRVVAVPVSRMGDRLRVAVADPGNVHGIDELKIATRFSIDLAVASRDDILSELDRMSRQSEVTETQSYLDEIEVVDEDDQDDLEADDGVSDAPLVRLVNSIIMQAAAENASDIHFAPAGGRARRPHPHRRRAAGAAADPQAHGVGRDDAPQGARQARHRRASASAGRPHLAERLRRRAYPRHPCRGAADGGR